MEQMKEDVKEMLRKQMELLAEQSKKPADTRELCDMTREMVRVAEVLCTWERK